MFKNLICPNCDDPYMLINISDENDHATLKCVNCEYEADSEELRLLANDLNRVAAVLDGIKNYNDCPVKTEVLPTTSPA